MRSALRLRLALALAAGLLVVVIGPLLGRPELLTFDWRQRWLPAEWSSSPRILIVAIDDESLRVGAEELHRFPWPRSAYARIIQALAQARPAAIGLDLLLPEPGPGDEELASVLETIPVVLACNAGEGGASGGLELEGTLPRHAPHWGVRQPPTGVLAASGFAMARVEAEEDGVTRRVPLVADNGGRSLSSMPAVLAARAGARVEATADGVRAGGRLVTGADGSLWPRFAGGVGSFRYRSSWELLRGWHLLADSGRSPRRCHIAAEIEGSVVIITVTATSLYELRTVPTARVYPGGELIATAMANLLDGRGVRSLSGWGQAGLALGAALLLGLVAVPIRRPALLALAWAGLTVAWGGIAMAVWQWADVWWPVAAPWTAMAVAAGAILVEGWWREGAERRRVQGIFGHYVAPDILKVLLEHPEAARLGGERRRITVLFSDIRSYTTLSEKLSPEAVVGWLNEYFGGPGGGHPRTPRHRGQVHRRRRHGVLGRAAARTGAGTAGGRVCRRDDSNLHGAWPPTGPVGKVRPWRSASGSPRAMRWSATWGLRSCAPTRPSATR